MLLPNCDSSVEYVLAYFIKERMDIFWGRVAQDDPPFTSDPILQAYKFTNVYRATDRVSQYLIRNVQYNHPWCEEDLIFRTLLFKLFNINSTWDGLLEVLGFEPTLASFLEPGGMELYQNALDLVKISYPVIYNNAYMMNGRFPRYGFKEKHYSHLALLADILNPQNGFVEQAVKAQSLPELHRLLYAQYNIGEFLAYQFTIDMNYTPIWQFDENGIYMATVGSKRGIEKLLYGKKPKSYADIIQFYTTYQYHLLLAHDLDKGFVNLFGRPLKAIDMQNCFCELDKYMRVFKPDRKVSGSYQPSRIKNKFKRTQRPYLLYFPDWWGLPNNQYTVY